MRAGNRVWIQLGERKWVGVVKEVQSFGLYLIMASESWRTVDGEERTIFEDVKAFFPWYILSSPIIVLKDGDNT